MKSTRLAILLIASAFLLACVAPPGGSAQQSQAPVGGQSAAPTGTYTSPLRFLRTTPPISRSNSVPMLTLRLETNGTYLAKSGLPDQTTYIDGTYPYHMPDISKGTWRWDARNQEFLLDPGGFTYGSIQCLPVDKGNPNRLVWGHRFLERQGAK
jgi:hypothetical protein